MKMTPKYLLAGAILLANTAVSTAMASGEEIYKSKCFACHDAGVAGAPKTGDKEAWAARIEKGIETLYEVSINGSESGIMPPKGGFSALSDDEVKAAVDYMVEASK